MPLLTLCEPWFTDNSGVENPAGASVRFCPAVSCVDGLSPTDENANDNHSGQADDEGELLSQHIVCLQTRCDETSGLLRDGESTTSSCKPRADKTAPDLRSVGLALRGQMNLRSLHRAAD
jgi:hypothetical protein